MEVCLCNFAIIVTQTSCSEVARQLNYHEFSCVLLRAIKKISLSITKMNDRKCKLCKQVSFCNLVSLCSLCLRTN